MNLSQDIVAQKEADFARKRKLVKVFLYVICTVFFLFCSLHSLNALFGKGSSLGLFIVIFLASFIIPAIYFLPTWIALRRKCASLVGIFVLNALCGWWGVPIILLSIWAWVGKTIYQSGTVAIGVPSTSADELQKLLMLKQSGVLSVEEFEVAKKKILG